MNIHNYKPCHVAIKYRHHTKKGDHARSIYLNSFLFFSLFWVVMPFCHVCKGVLEYSSSGMHYLVSMLFM